MKLVWNTERSIAM